MYGGKLKQRLTLSQWLSHYYYPHFPPASTWRISTANLQVNRRLMSSSASLKALQHRAESQKERWCRQFAIEWRCWLLIAHHLASWRAQPQRGLQVWRVAKSVFRTGGCIARSKPPPECDPHWFSNIWNDRLSQTPMLRLQDWKE